MGLLRRIGSFLSWGSKDSGRSAGSSKISARYDNALTTPENSRNWWGADYLSAKSANSFQVRRMLRTRSRYEFSNNPYLFGICHNNADDLIDKGPTLQIKTKSNKFNHAVETLWKQWCEEVGLVDKIRTAKLAKSVDGEGFLILKTVEDLENPVKLYPVDVEADQVTTPAPSNLTELWVDGLTLHKTTGQPTHYHVMRSHPGDFFFPGLNPLQVDRIAASHVIHWFSKNRPGMVRGVPIFTPSLDLFGELRAFRRAVLKNAQVAASFTAVLESEVPADTTDGDDPYEAFLTANIEPGVMTQLPAGFKLNGFDAKQPQTTYEMFQEKCLSEAIRPLGYPLNLALGTSQKFNFSSSKLDHINYRNSLDIERAQCDAIVLNKLFAAFYEEAVLCGALPAWIGGISPPPHEWHWPAYKSLDPLVDANADAARIAAGLTSWTQYWASQGKDFRVMIKRIAREQREIERLGVTIGDVIKRTVTVSADEIDKQNKVPTGEVANAV